MQKVPFFKHDLGETELQAISEVLQGNILTTGDFVASFESKFSRYLQANHAVGLTSCTAALHLSLEALGIKEGDEVITTPLSFIATSTAILHSGARPIFVDVEADTGNLDTKRIVEAITPRTKAILPVHLFGQMCDMKSLRNIADKYGLSIVEDAAHCIEGERDGIRPGQLGDTACFSFYATKNITCGEGGAVVTQSQKLAEQIALLRTHGMDSTASDRDKHGYSHWDMPILGWKYNMDNIQASMLLPQMERIEINLEKRKRLVQRYRERLKPCQDITLFETQPKVKHCYHLMPIRVAANKRDKLIDFLSASGIGCVVNYRPIHTFSYFAKNLPYNTGQFPIAENIGDEVISLPLYPELKLETVDWVCNQVRKFFDD